MRVDWTSPTLVSLCQLFRTFCLMCACWDFTCKVSAWQFLFSWQLFILFYLLQLWKAQSDNEKVCYLDLILETLVAIAMPVLFSNVL